MKKGIYFNTKSNTYFYDSASGKVTMCAVKKGDQVVFGNTKNETLRMRKKVKENLLDSVKQFGFSQLTLILTEECNLRCSYCIYSGNYSHNRKHENNFMSFDIAKKSCDDYLNSFYQSQNIFPLKVPVIGFYGGEPLLNYEVLKKTVEYLNHTYYKINYTISTNGILLNDEIMKFLTDNNFSIAVSINGDENENDRLRIAKDNKGTYNKVFDNIVKISKMSKTPILLLSTIDSGTNVYELKKYFEKFEENSNVVIARISQVLGDYTDWYDRYSSAQKSSFINQIEIIRSEFHSKLLNNIKMTNFENLFFGIEYKRIINLIKNRTNDEIEKSMSIKLGICIPSTKIAVDYSGNYYICEKVNNTRSIGNCQDGLNYKNIEKIMDDFNRSTIQCSRCPINDLCDFCFASNLNAKGIFETPCSKTCDSKREKVLKTFKEVYELQENGVNLFTYFEN